MRDDQIRDKWREAGGSFHGPRVEHASMEERAFLRFLGGLYDEIAELRAALEWQPIETRPVGHGPCWIACELSQVVAYVHGDGTWRIMWSDRPVPFTPTHWQPLPRALRSRQQGE